MMYVSSTTTCKKKSPLQKMLVSLADFYMRWCFCQFLLALLLITAVGLEVIDSNNKVCPIVQQLYISIL